MRYVNMLLGVLMVAFAAVQYNDPDGPLWAAIYLVPAAWAIVAAFWLPRVRSVPGAWLLGLSTLAGVALVVYYWPSAPGFWRQEIWWNDEAAREGMGAMIALAVLLFVSASALTARSRRS